MYVNNTYFQRKFFQLFVQNINQVEILGILSPSTSFNRIDIEVVKLIVSNLNVVKMNLLKPSVANVLVHTYELWIVIKS